MRKKNTTKTVKLSAEVLEALEADARRCLKTVPKHIAAILCAYTQIEDVSMKRCRKSDDILDAEVIE